MRTTFWTAVAGLMVAMPAAAAPIIDQRAKVLDDVLACRSEHDAAARLACFDRGAATLGSAAERKDVVVVDRTQVQQARASLFGFSLPRLSILGFGGREDDDGPQEITGTIRSARQDHAGSWVLTLADGAVWHQTDQSTPIKPLHAGSSVVIRRAALGTFFVRVDGHLGFRARRDS